MSSNGFFYLPRDPYVSCDKLSVIYYDSQSGIYIDIDCQIMREEIQGKVLKLLPRIKLQISSPNLYFLYLFISIIQVGDG